MAPVRTVDAEAAKILGRALRQALGEGRQDPRAGLEQIDPGLGRVDGVEVLGEAMAGDLGERPGELDAGRAATDDHEGELAVALGLVSAPLGRLEGEQDPAADHQGVLEALEAGGDRLPLVVAEVGMADARREDQVVVGDRLAGDVDLAGDGVDPLDFGEQRPQVLLAAQDGPDRCGDVGGREGGRRNLVEEGLEEVVVAAVDEGDLDVLAGQPFRGVQTAEPTADDDDPRLPGALRSHAHALPATVVLVGDQLSLDLAERAEGDVALDEGDDGLEHLIGVAAVVRDADDADRRDPPVVEVLDLRDTGVELDAGPGNDRLDDAPLLLEGGRLGQVEGDAGGADRHDAPSIVAAE
jgi:hypothetical protein